MKIWQSGETAVVRGIFNKRVWLAQSTLVVKDTADETILLLLPGAECAYPEGYWHWKHGDFSRGTRWQEAMLNSWKLRKFGWLNNQFLIFIEPQNYYALYAIWQHETDQFQGYYIDFQLPDKRSDVGFDTLDLDLDIVIDPQLNWKWKDEAEYLEGIQQGGIQKSWAEAVGAPRNRKSSPALTSGGIHWTGPG